MNSQILYIIIGAVAVAMLGIGLLAGKLTFGKSSKKEREQALIDAQKTISDAKSEGGDSETEE